MQSSELLLEPRDQRITKREEMRRPRAKAGMIAAGMNEDRAEEIAILDRADDRGDHVHAKKCPQPTWPCSNLE